jgi:hypothetical protein
MAALADIRAGLAANLRAAISGVQVNEYTLSNPTPPCFEIDLAAEGLSFDAASNRGIVTMTMIVRLVLTVGSDYGSQRMLDNYIDGSADTDVKAAVETDMTLGGAAHTLRVAGVQLRRWKSDTSGSLLYGAEWTVVVYAAGTS